MTEKDLLQAIVHEQVECRRRCDALVRAYATDLLVSPTIMQAIDVATENIIKELAKQKVQKDEGD